MKNEDKIKCECPHCKKIIEPTWCHIGNYYECPECSMAFRDNDDSDGENQDYDIKWV